MRRRDDHMKTGVIERQRTRARQGIQQVEEEGEERSEEENKEEERREQETLQRPSPLHAHDI